MKTRTIYRLEAPCGTGCFNHGSGAYLYTEAAEFAGIHNRDEGYFHNKFPSPFQDAALEADKHAKGLDLWKLNCGFASLEQAREWFPEPLVGALAENDQELTVWEVDVDDVAVGDSQVMFDRDAAHLAQRLPVTALHDGSI